MTRARVALFGHVRLNLSTLATLIFGLSLITLHLFFILRSFAIIPL